MKARTIGFEVSTCDGLSLQDVLSELKEHSGREVATSKKAKRRIYVELVEKTYVGLILSPRDQSRDVRMKEEDGEVELIIQELGKDIRLADFNFFVVPEGCNKGLYQRYRGSCPIPTFGGILRTTHTKLKRERRNAELADEVPKGVTKKTRDQEVRDRYKGKCELTPLYLPREFKKLLDDMDAIDEFSYTLTSLCAEDKPFEPLATHMSSQRKVIRFERSKTPFGKVRSAIKTAISKLKLTNASVAGSTKGKRTRYRLQYNPSVFDETEYDTIADASTLRIRGLDKSPFVHTLFAKIAENKELVFRST